MGLPLEKNRRYTYDDYATWPDDVRCELIDGVIYDMTPAPGTKHQMYSGKLYAIMLFKMKGHRCQIFIAPTDVVLSKHDVVQPDIFVVCDRNKITDKNIQGAPDIAIEFLSPGTTLKDLREKKRLYQKFGVKEYVLIHPIDRYAEHHLFRDGQSGEPAYIGETETLVFETLEKMEIPMADVFAE